MTKRKQITFDIDTNVTKMILGNGSYTNIYTDIRKYMEKNEWQHIEGSVYMSKKPMSNTKVAKILDSMIKEYPYLTKCIRDMHQTDISEIHSLAYRFDYDGTPGRFAKPEIEHKVKPKHRSR